MSFEKNFCPSPWYHMRINNAGHYEYCRWASKGERRTEASIREVSPVVWFQKHMSGIRQAMLNGDTIPGCNDCIKMEQHGKVSGRQRQLLKIGVREENFVPALQSSPWMSTFSYSQANNGDTDQLPQDWQIDLGNYCNSACLFCNPHSSSRLAAEWKRIGIIDSVPRSAWCEDPGLLDSFLSMLKASPSIRYLHFIGGETVITPAFVKILQALVDADLQQEISIGFTVNLTIWDADLIALLSKFKLVQLGVSIECFHPANDYARYGSNIDSVTQVLDLWLDSAEQHNWLVQIRPTPTILTILHYPTIYEYAIPRNITVESCNFLNDPAYMRPTVLPMEYRQPIIDRLKAVAATIPLTDSTQVINTRNRYLNSGQLWQDINSYVNYLETAPDESYRLPELVTYLKKMEASRKNSVLDYLPEYEKLLRTAGY